MSIKQNFRTTMKKINGDLLTPILIFSRLQGKRKFLLESSSKFEGSGRYSFIGANPRKTYSGAGTTLTEHSHLTNKSYSYEGNLIHSLKQVMPRISNHTEYPFTGGAIGYIGYGVNQLDSRLQDTELELPTVNFHVYDTMIIFDHVTDELIVFHTNIEAEQTEPNIDDILEQLLQSKSMETMDYSLSAFHPQTTEEEFEQQFNHLQQALAGNEVAQVVLSRRLEAAFEGDAFALYRKLRIENLAPYMYYMEFDDHTIVGSSPESLVRVKNGIVTTKPVTGIRSRGLTTAEDFTIEQELQSNTKEIAAHHTLVELTKIDVEKVCVAGSVKVTNSLETIRSEQAIQLASEVEGKLSPSLHPIDALAHCVSATCVTGSPKHKAMQLIDQIEPVHRSFYGGALGYIGFNGQIDFALTTRTMLIKNSKAFLQLGTTITTETTRKDATEQIKMKTQSLSSLAKGD